MTIISLKRLGARPSKMQSSSTEGDIASIHPRKCIILAIELRFH